jgi:lipopolysaccharide transport system ATP-binding protein
MDVVTRYVQWQADATREITPATAPVAFTPAGERLEVHHNRFGSLEATIEAAWISDAWGEKRTTFQTGSGVRLEMDLAIPDAIGDAWASVTIRRSDDLVCMDTCSTISGHERTERVRVDIDRLDLAAGDYLLDIGLFNADWSRTFDYHYGAYGFKMTGPTPGAGMMAPPISWQVLPKAVVR